MASPHSRIGTSERNGRKSQTHRHLSLRLDLVPALPAICGWILFWALPVICGWIRFWALPVVCGCISNRSARGYDESRPRDPLCSPRSPQVTSRRRRLGRFE